MLLQFIVYPHIFYRHVQDQNKVFNFKAGKNLPVNRLAFYFQGNLCHGTDGVFHTETAVSIGLKDVFRVVGSIL